jgi:hypothetical protein
VTNVPQEENTNLPEPPDPMTLQSRDVLTHYGLTMWYVQSFEHRLKGILLGFHATEHPSIDPEQWEEILTITVPKATLQRVVRNLNPPLPFPDNVYSIWEKMIDVRNWLAHTYLTDVSYPLQSEDGRRRVIEELKFFTKAFMAMSQRMGRVLDLFVEGALDKSNLLGKLGYTKEELEQEAREFNRQVQESLLRKRVAEQSYLKKDPF